MAAEKCVQFAIDVYDDHLEVTVKGTPKLNVTLAEVGLGRKGEDWSCRRTVRDRHYTAGTAAAMVHCRQVRRSMSHVAACCLFR
ncbi:MAG: hypothetical protein QOI44_1319 [Actinomycetota bacterium]|jgi:hypothetical protein|nr:hypothetical protein [Actinomycetota bacterium]